MEVEMQVRLLMGCAVGGRLVDAGRVWERRPEQVVVSRGEPLDYVGELLAFDIGQDAEVRHRPPAHDERLERPHGPEGDEGHEAVVRAHYSFVARQLEREVVRKQRTSMSVMMLAQRCELAGGLVRQRA